MRHPPYGGRSGATRTRRDAGASKTGHHPPYGGQSGATRRAAARCRRDSRQDGGVTKKGYRIYLSPSPMQYRFTSPREYSLFPTNTGEFCVHSLRSKP